MTSVSAGHIILTPTQPVASGRPQRESNPEPPHQESRTLPTELPHPKEWLITGLIYMVCMNITIEITSSQIAHVIIQCTPPVFFFFFFFFFLIRLTESHRGHDESKLYTFGRSGTVTQNEFQRIVDQI